MQLLYVKVIAYFHFNFYVVYPYREKTQNHI